jgi:hypothetical protein
MTPRASNPSPDRPEREDHDLRRHPEAHGESERAQTAIQRQKDEVARAWRRLIA